MTRKFSEIYPNPPGEIAQFMTSTMPSGWLQLLGTNVSRTTYAALFAKIGTTYGAGDGATTFTLPTLLSFLALFGAGTPLSSGRARHTASVLSDGRILIVGGSDNNEVTRAETYFGTILGNAITWVSGTSLPAVRNSHTASVLSDGRILVTGGSDGAVRAETYFGTIARWGIRT